MQKHRRYSYGLTYIRAGRQIFNKVSQFARSNIGCAQSVLSKKITFIYRQIDVCSERYFLHAMKVWVIKNDFSLAGAARQ